MTIKAPTRTKNTLAADLKPAVASVAPTTAAAATAQAAIPSTDAVEASRGVDVAQVPVGEPDAHGAQQVEARAQTEAVQTKGKAKSRAKAAAAAIEALRAPQDAPRLKPVMGRAIAPDPQIRRVRLADGTQVFRMISTSNAPLLANSVSSGVFPVLESKDLKEWRHVGHLFPNLGAIASWALADFDKAARRYNDHARPLPEGWAPEEEAIANPFTGKHGPLVEIPGFPGQYAPLLALAKPGTTFFPYSSKTPSTEERLLTFTARRKQETAPGRDGQLVIGAALARDASDFTQGYRNLMRVQPDGTVAEVPLIESDRVGHIDATVVFDDPNAPEPLLFFVTKGECYGTTYRVHWAHAKQVGDPLSLNDFITNTTPVLAQAGQYSFGHMSIQPLGDDPPKQNGGWLLYKEDGNATGDDSVMNARKFKIEDGVFTWEGDAKEIYRSDEVNEGWCGLRAKPGIYVVSGHFKDKSGDVKWGPEANAKDGKNADTVEDDARMAAIVYVRIQDDGTPQVISEEEAHRALAAAQAAKVPTPAEPPTAAA